MVVILTLLELACSCYVQVWLVYSSWGSILPFPNFLRSDYNNSETGRVKTMCEKNQ